MTVSPSTGSSSADHSWLEKICAQLDTDDETVLFEKGFPYLVVFDEINADAEKIREKEKLLNAK